MKQPLSPAKIEANRRNAQSSTGPRTPEGRAAVSLNSLTHGIRARAVPLPTEMTDELRQLCADYFAEWQPKTQTEVDLLEQMAVTKWKLARAETTEGTSSLQSTLVCLALRDFNEFVTEKGIVNMPDVVDKREKQICHELDQIRNHIARLERSWFRAFESLQRLQDRRIKKESRLPEPAPAPEAPKVQAAGSGSIEFAAFTTTPQQPPAPSRERKRPVPTL
jgi:hypothetical protein